MNEQREERLVLAFEAIGIALRGIHDTLERQLAKQFPEPKEWREAAYSRILTEEERIREDQGASEEPIEEWLTLPEGEWIGRREREFLAGAQTAAPSEPDSSGAETAEGEAGTGGKSAPDYPDVQAG
jgi:hypothetical protein